MKVNIDFVNGNWCCHLHGWFGRTE